MLPTNLQREFEREVIPSDASLILITHSQYQHLACALPLVLAAIDPDCRIVCVPEIADELRSTRMLNESKLISINKGGSIDLGYVRLTNVHADHAESGSPKCQSV